MIRYPQVNGAANNEYALRASRESLVLLKNNGFLPMDASEQVSHSSVALGRTASEAIDAFFVVSHKSRNNLPAIYEGAEKDASLISL